MSRGGGRGGKRVRTQIRAKGEDEDGHPLTLTQPKPEDFQPPPLYPPLASTPQPFSPASPLSSQYLHTASLLHDQYSYGGYRLTRERRESVRLERYSDRYRRRQGQRSFLDECPQPSPFLFPAELQRWDRGSGRGSAAGSSGGSNRWLLMSAEALQSHLDRLTVVRDEAAVTEAGGAASTVGPMKEERKDGPAGADGAAAAEDEEKEDDRKKRRGAGDDEDGDEDEDEDAERAEDDDEDDMGGGDYTDRYQEDDDGEGDDVFGDDDGDVF